VISLVKVSTGQRAAVARRLGTRLEDFVDCPIKLLELVRLAQPAARVPQGFSFAACPGGA